MNIVYSMLLDFWSLEGAGDQISEIRTVSANSKKYSPESNCQSYCVTPKIPKSLFCNMTRYKADNLESDEAKQWRKILHPRSDTRHI